MATPAVKGVRIVRRVSKRPKPQTFDFYEGLVGSMHTVHGASINNAIKAVFARVLFFENPAGELERKLDSNPVAVRRLKIFALRATASAPSTSPLLLESLVAQLRGARKRQRMWAAGTALRRRSLRKRDARVKAFVKREAVKTGKPCRLIQARSDEYLCDLARYIRPMEHPIYEAIDRFAGYKCIMKGLNGVERAARAKEAWDSFRRPVAVSFDFAKYDQHHGVGPLGVEHAVYRSKNGASELDKMLDWQLENRGRVVCADGVISYSVRGCRMSGDPNTSLGNIIVCATGHLAYARSIGVRCVVLNDGDDSVIILEEANQQRFVEGISAYWRELGFILTCDGVAKEFSHIDFCQCRPVCVSGTWAFIRDPAKAVQKDLTCTQHLTTERERLAWLHAVGVGGLSGYRGVPVQSALYKKMASVGVHHASRYQWRAEMEKTARYRRTGLRGGDFIDDRTRFSYWQAFGITPTEQLALEHEILTTHLSAGSIQHGLPRPCHLTLLLKRHG